MNASSHLPPVRCAHWCRYGTGHTDAALPADQTCFSEPVETPLSIAQPTAVRGWTSQDRAYVALSLKHHTRDAEPIVETGLNDSSGILLTLDEAERYASSLLHEVGRARREGER
jgi:hypothetical protein